METNECTILKGQQRSHTQITYTPPPDHITSNPCLLNISSIMPPRHFDIVLDSEPEFMEEVAYHQRTKPGMKTMYKQMPVEQPPQEKAGQSSHLQSRKNRQTKLPDGVQTEPHNVEVIQPEPDNIDDMAPHLLIEGEEDELPGISSEEMQPLETVWSHIFC